MTNNRLSKLQKWILKECYMRKINSLFPKPEMTRQDILAGFHKWKKKVVQELHKSIYLPKDFNVKIEYDKEGYIIDEVGYKKYMKKQVALTNSLKNLIKKGLIKAVGRNKKNERYGTDDLYLPIKLKDNKLVGESRSSIIRANIHKIRLTKKGIEKAKELIIK